MWVLAMFDLPTDTPKMRKRYRQFREKLLKDGFIMLQFSVYARPCANKERADIHAARVEDAVPDEGQVRVLTLTELQFLRMKIFSGKYSLPPEKEPNQLSFW